MIPTPWAGVKWRNGDIKPVMLVATVVLRKTAVQRRQDLAASIAAATTKPATMATRLMMT